MVDIDERASSVSDAAVATFWRDGVVCLRGVISEDWLRRIERPIEAWLASPDCLDFSAYAGEISRQTGASLMLEDRPADRPRGRFYSGTDHWQRSPDLFAFAAELQLPSIVGALLRSDTINLYEDSILVKEPGTPEKTAFHQDIAYFHAEGSQICTTWIPLDPVTLASGGLKFIRGSHLWKEQFRPNFFVTDYSMPGTDGIAVPDFHKDSRGNKIISFEMQPGDITIHHARTIHGADGNASATFRRRALSVRYCGSDARFKLRKGLPQKPHHPTMREGEPMDHPGCPLVWRA